MFESYYEGTTPALIYNHLSFIKCPKKKKKKQSLTVLLEDRAPRQREWENSKQATCTAYTRATATESFSSINTEVESIGTNLEPLNPAVIQTPQLPGTNARPPSALGTV